MRYEDLVKVQALVASLEGLRGLRESLRHQFSSDVEVSLVFTEEGESLDFDGIEMSYVKSMLNTVEEDLKSQMRVLGVTFREDVLPSASEG